MVCDLGNIWITLTSVSTWSLTLLSILLKPKAYELGGRCGCWAQCKEQPVSSEAPFLLWGSRCTPLVSCILICKVRKRWGWESVLLRTQASWRVRWLKRWCCCLALEKWFTGAQLQDKGKAGRALFLQVGNIFITLCVTLCSFPPVMSRGGFVAHRSMLCS